MTDTGPLQVLAILPWYVHVLLGVMVAAFILTKALPFLREAKRVVSTKRYLQNPNGSSLSLEQRRSLSVGAIGAEQQGFLVDTLDTGQGASDLRSKLQEWWNIDSREAALQTLWWLSEEGHRALFDRLLRLYVEVPPPERARAVRSRFAGEERAVEYLGNLEAALKTLREEGVLSGEETLHGTTLAWDLGRLVMVARSCHTAGYLAEAEAWSLIQRAHSEAARAFADWRAFSRSFLVGRALWGGDDMALPGLCAIGQGLQQDAASPWRSAPLRS